MSPDSPETRIGRLEREMAGIQQRVEDLSTEVRALTPLVVGFAELRIALNHVQSDVHDLTGEVSSLNTKLDVREQTRQQGESQRRWQGYAIAASIACVLLAVLAQIIITLAGAT